MGEKTPLSWESMTGFAVYEAKLGSKSFRFQLKSVNHRFFEFRMRAPKDFFAAELEFKRSFKDILRRGSVELQIEKKDSGDESAEKDFLDSVRSLKDRYERASRIFSPSEGEKGAFLQALVGLSKNGDLESTKFDDSEKNLKVIQEISEKLATSLVGSRRKEGGELRKALERDHFVLRQAWKEFSAKLPELQRLWREDSQKRIQEWSEKFAMKTPDSDRIYQEFVLLLERRDVAEELQRIDSHLKALNEFLVGSKAVENLGKRLDFLAQELHREWTTLNNKVSDTALSPVVADAKLAIERIREQSLNLV